MHPAEEIIGKISSTEIREMLFSIQYEEIRCLSAEIYTTLILCKEAEKAVEVGYLEGLRNNSLPLSSVEAITLDNGSERSDMFL